MSLMTDILDRLTGIAIVRAKLDETTDRVEHVGAWLLDHEKRIVRLEAKADLAPVPTRKPRRLPKK